MKATKPWNRLARSSVRPNFVLGRPSWCDTWTRCFLECLSYVYDGTLTLYLHLVIIRAYQGCVCPVGTVAAPIAYYDSGPVGHSGPKGSSRPKTGPKGKEFDPASTYYEAKFTPWYSIFRIYPLRRDHGRSAVVLFMYSESLDSHLSLVHPWAQSQSQSSMVIRMIKPG